MSGGDGMTTRPAVQVVVPGRLSTDMRMVEGVGKAMTRATKVLQVPAGSVYLAAVETDHDNNWVVYTFGVR